ncbi:hypothetical protein BD779DRAFT_1493701 [Infundibulicybe gibba]|nr:hypothetical protein BD779DRAFT_1493701 [Infundibulicybe gibba]
MAEEYIHSAILHNIAYPASIGGVGGISVSAVTTSAKTGKGGPDGHLGTPGKEAGATYGQSVVSVVADLTGLNRRDVSNSLEFASRASNHVAKENTKEWFKEYIESVAKLGWAKQSIKSHEIDLSSVSPGTTFATLVKEIVQKDPDFNDSQKKVVILTLDSLIKQQSRRELFNSFTSGGKESTFGVTAAAVKNGSLSLRMVGFYFEANQTVTDCLLFKVSKSNIKISTHTTDAFANQGTLDANRAKIEAKLQSLVTDYIDDTPLD